MTYLIDRGAHLLVCMKGNQPGLLKRLKKLPWKHVPVGHTTTGRAHGRIEERTLKVATVTDSASWIRQHWHIENRPHRVRDVTLGEDLHQARGNGPHVLATSETSSSAPYATTADTPITSHS